MILTILDIEADALYDEVTLIHCLSYTQITETGTMISSGTITDYKKMVEFLKNQQIIVGHNIILYDIPVIKKILGYEVTCTLWDTLALSWYLYPKLKEHGLEYWGNYLNAPKPQISDWKNQSLEDYIHRCQIDVEINKRLWLKMVLYLNKIYGELGWVNFLHYLSFKLDCIREQEEEFCKINRVKCYEHLDEVMRLIGIKTEELSASMPLNPIYVKKTKPKVMYKKDKSLSSHGEKWLDLCSQHNVDPEVTEEFKVILKYDKGNPASVPQLKSWLFSLGWKPTIFKDSVSKVTNISKKVPQISNDKGKICPSLKSLFKEHPYLEAIEGLSILNHRRGVFKSFLEAMNEDDKVRASIGGLTNTLRFQHRKPIANLVKVSKPWGKEIRGVIIPPLEEHVLCGSDMSSLEDTTKQHYMYYFDPKYVTQMRVPGFDPHIDIALVAGLMSEEEAEVFKKLKYRDEVLGEKLSEEENQIYHYLSEVRGNAKTVNFAAVYGAGPAKIAETLKCSLEFAQKLHKAYWDRNKAVKQVAKSVLYKEVDGQLWLYNPVSQFWYSLRAEKDIFSTLNQGTGVYCFDSWLRKVRKKGVRIMLQYHDEKCSSLLKGDENTVREKLQSAIAEVNEEVKLNVPLGISVKFGTNYSDTH